MPARFILLAVCVCTVTACARRERKTVKPVKRQAMRMIDRSTRKTDKTDPKTGESESAAVAEVPKKAERKENRGKEKKQQTIVIAGQRTYRLEVDKLDATVYAAFWKQWSFSGEFPAELLRGIRENPKLKKSKFPFFPDGDKNADSESGTIRWPPDAKGQHAGAILWFIDGDKRKEVVIRVDLPLDHTLGQSRPPLPLAFDQLHVSIDLKTSKMSGVRWSQVKLPDESSKSPAIDVEASLEITVTGRLTDESSKSIRLANRLLSEDFMQKLGGRGRIDLSNESHHGITLGWLGYERLRHSLMFLAGKPNEAVTFLYRIDGTSFPLMLLRRQLQDDGWPMVLRGHEYVGTAENGVPVFRPVEYLLSKRLAKKTSPKKKPKRK